MIVARSSSASLRAGGARQASSQNRSAARQPGAAARRSTRLVVRAESGDAAPEVADPEAEAEAAAQAAAAGDDFDFSLSDAKKNNQWQPSDVQAALDYYANEEFLTGSRSLPVEAEFVTNPLSAYAGGPEDSSWLADVDNNEAYENDDYALAGIPEAAPKVKRNQREEEDDNEEELRAMEDEKISAAAFDDIEGFEDEGDDNPEAAWNWRFAGDEAADEAPAGIRVSDDAAFLASLSNLDVSQHDDLSPEQKDLISVVLDNVAVDEGLDLIGEDLAEPSDEVVGLSPEEEARIAALLAEEVDMSDILQADIPDISDDLAAAAQEEALADGSSLDPAAVAAYVATLKAVDPATTGVDDARLAELLSKAGEAGEPVAPAVELGTAPAIDSDVEALIGAKDASLEPFVPEAAAEDSGAAEAIALFTNIQALSSDVTDINDMILPAAEDLQEYESFIDTALEYYNTAGEEEEALLTERPEDAPVNAFADIDPTLLGATDAYGEEDGFERSEGRFVERILELGRVTKVVKGGKIMGFRCVAVVGDGKGRVGVGCQAGREVSTAVKRALVDAKKSLIEVPLVGAGTIPHRSEAWFKAAGVVLQPAADGTGVIAGGAVRSVLELAGVQNVLAKRLGSRSCLNNARVTIKALSELRTMDDYAAARGIPLDYMLS